MLALTPTAVEVVDSIVSNGELPETAGIRITSEQTQSGLNGDSPQRDLRISVVAVPASGEELVEGAQIYVEPGETARLLDDKVLDVELDDEEVRFSLLRQE
jgi:hypothetical protein